MKTDPSDPLLRITNQQFPDGSSLVIDEGAIISLLLPEVAPRLRRAEELAFRLLAENPGKEIAVPIDMRGIVPAAIGCAVAVFQCGRTNPAEQGWKWLVAIGGGEAKRRLDEAWRSLSRVPAGSAASVRHFSI